METVFKFVAALVGIIVGAAIVGCLMAYPVMWIINSLFSPAALTAAFGVAQLGFVKSLQLSCICSILFSSGSSSSSSKS